MEKIKNHVDQYGEVNVHTYVDSVIFVSKNDEEAFLALVVEFGNVSAMVMRAKLVLTGVIPNEDIGKSLDKLENLLVVRNALKGSLLAQYEIMCDKAKSCSPYANANANGVNV